MEKVRFLISVCVMFAVCVCGSYADEPAKQMMPGGKTLLKKIQAFIDSASVDGIDKRYIEVPEKPWQIVLRTNVTQSDLHMSSKLDAQQYLSTSKEKLAWKPRICTDITTYAGAWVGYRGYGIGLSKNISGDKGSLLTIGATGSNYSLNMRLHDFQTDEPKVHLIGWFESDDNPDVLELTDQTTSFYLNSPMEVKTLTVDGYYFFNKKKFSNLAAYDQSVIQRRSAGSPVVGAMFFYSRVRYDHSMNNDFILFMNNIGKIKQWQASIGGGYAYNWVIGKNLLINATVMPMIAFHNRVKIYTYDSFLLGKLKIDDSEIDMLAPEDWWIKPMGTKTFNSRMKLNIDAHLSVTYNLKNWFFNANGQFCNFRYKHSTAKGYLNDWYVNASVGLRL